MECHRQRLMPVVRPSPVLLTLDCLFVDCLISCSVHDQEVLNILFEARGWAGANCPGKCWLIPWPIRRLRFYILVEHIRKDNLSRLCFSVQIPIRLNCDRGLIGLAAFCLLSLVPPFVMIIWQALKRFGKCIRWPLFPKGPLDSHFLELAELKNCLKSFWQFSCNQDWRRCILSPVYPFQE